MVDPLFPSGGSTAAARALIAVSGAEALGFLDDLLTQRMARLESEPILYAGLLTAPGKLISDFFVWRTGADAVLIDAPASRGEALLAILKRYRLRRPVTINPLSDRFTVWTGSAPTVPNAVPDPRHPGLGFRALVEPWVGGGRFDLAEAQIWAGAPDLAVDAEPEEVFALEALFEELNGVDFHKGCFVGQETVSRMKRRATTRRKFCRVAYEGAPPPFGAAITAGAADLGAMRSGLQNTGIALLRLDRALEATAAGEVILCDGRALRLDPPDWLLLPSAKEDS